VEFRAVRPGVYFYWGTTTSASLDKRTGVDSQLSGALIVDPRGAGTLPDRVFVLGHWDQEGDAKSIPPKPELETWVINGKSWPNTERLIYPAGRLVRWRWINATDENHPLHLHGHYFLVEAIGGQKHWVELPFLPGRRSHFPGFPNVRANGSFTVTFYFTFHPNCGRRLRFQALTMKSTMRADTWLGWCSALRSSNRGRCPLRLVHSNHVDSAWSLDSDKGCKFVWPERWVTL
jgi:hypothetical protein